MSDTTDKMSGKLKQAVGGITGNDRLKNEGKMEEAKGDAKTKLKHVGDKIGDAIDGAKKKAD
jgi:uncharacterized protein YjbJ (UPF0337 family)